MQGIWDPAIPGRSQTGLWTGGRDRCDFERYCKLYRRILYRRNQGWCPVRWSSRFSEESTETFLYYDQTAGSASCERLLGIQFDTLFTGNLYLEISKNAIETAAKLKAALKEKGYEFFINSPTNQIFVILENKKMEELGEKVKFSFWEKYDDSHTVVRFATSWATKMEDIDSLIETL